MNVALGERRAVDRKPAVRPSLVSVLCAVAVSLILVGGSGRPLAGMTGAARAAMRAAFAPAESAGAAAFRPLDESLAGWRRSGDVAGLRADLAREQTRTGAEAGRADALAAENGRLAALLNLPGAGGGEGVAARVVSTGTGATVLVDRGSADGIGVGMPVVAAGGLVGRVTEVAPHHSTVLPLTDAASAVGIRIDPAAAPGPDGAGGAAVAGVAQGLDARALRLDLLDPNAPVRGGDLAVTSGLRHSRFPAGIPVGRVSGAKGHLALQPFAPPDRLDLVKILRWSPQP